MSNPKPGKVKKATIQWLTFEEAVAKSKKEPRKIFIDVYTDWCGWCRKMEKSTFTDPTIADYVNKNFYAVRLDAEGETPITVNGKIYKYNEANRSHELAFALLQGQLSFPTTVYLDENLKMISPVPGYLDVKTFRNIITYFGENHYKKVTFAQFTSGQKPTGK
ncbi:thioredoxin [Adhaeribacter arboris]|uniref:Thioredoxin n=2 Tax=Adhaeribacter arboris TaxID=2072846 RepID=A0A2T2YNX3_9BACT|nr:thioredoxin [Adhaeribacter arboris]